MTAPAAEAITARLDDLRHRIEAAGGDPDRVLVVGVTKGLGADVVVAARSAGIADLGENYAQELDAKARVLPDEVSAGLRWHFIGRLQRNKVALAARHVSLWQTIDRLPLGVEVARRAPGAAVLVQVNLTDDPERGGCPPEEVAPLVSGLRHLDLDVRGLMAVGPPGGPEAARPGFRWLRACADQLGLPERSMGMSADLEVAIEEGATMVRVGTALFGPRPERRPRFSRPDVRH